MSVSQLKKIDATLPVRFATGQKTASGKTAYKSPVRIGRFYPQVVHASGENAVANDNSVSGRTIHTDHLGTPVKMTDSEQKVVWERVSDPFGETTRIDGPATLNIRFAGQYYDSESGLNQNFFRSYDPTKGRYTQSDPIGLVAGINTYGYVGQNPLRWIDPSGLSLENTNAPVSISPQLPTPQISSPQSSGSECTVNGNQNNVSPDDQIAANGGIYKNIGPGFLPIQPPGYYTEVYIPTDSGAAGTERLIYGQGGDVWYSPDHYETFVRIR